MLIFLTEEQDNKIKKIKEKTGKSKNDIVINILNKNIDKELREL